MSEFTLSPRLKIVRDDITKIKVDAIVNAANSRLAGGGGVDGAIHRAAGPELLEACRKIGGCPTGQAVITPGFQLPARFVIHTVGPVWQGGGKNEAALLADCYRNSLILAEGEKLETIAFSAISTGVYGYPIKEACCIAKATLEQFLQSQQWPKMVYLTAFNDEVWANLTNFT
ncbi:MAG: O-acetyl-ADP-ribose deacetylase [Alphaproteobacteria bacterium]|nr:MAG: O-acetyl-ADP-ribose deacetylase [Alphaproteobacteria bacterium]